MTLRHLTVFVTVCKHNNFTHAAEELHIAQPAVSTTISEIEKYYNIILFKRINKKVILTDEGKKLLIKAKEVLSSFEEFDNLAKQSLTETSLRFASSHTIGKTIIPKLLQEIKQKLPDVNVSVYINQTLEIERKIIDGTLDFALVEGNISLPNINAIPFAEDRLVAVCGKKFDIPDKINISELIKYPLLLREKGSASRDFVDGLFEVKSLNAIPSVESVSNEALAAIAARNLGIAVLPYSIVKHQIDINLKQLTIADTCLNRQYYFIYHKDRKINNIQKQIQELILK